MPYQKYRLPVAIAITVHFDVIVLTFMIQLSAMITELICVSKEASVWLTSSFSLRLVVYVDNVSPMR